MEKKLVGNYTKMLRAILVVVKPGGKPHKAPSIWATKYMGHLLPITKTIQVRRTRHAVYCWRNRDEFISDVLLWTPLHGRAKAGRTARTDIQLLSDDIGCSPADLPEAMNDMEKWRERVRDIHVGGTTRWWEMNFKHIFNAKILVLEFTPGCRITVI